MKRKYLPYVLIAFSIAFFITGCRILPYGNKAPTIGFKPFSSTKVEQVYTYDVNASDTENDVLTYSLLTYPEGMMIDALTGVIDWIPKKEQIGEHEVTVNVMDRWRNVTQNFTIVSSEIVLNSLEVVPSTITLSVTNSNLITRNFLIVTAKYGDGRSRSIVPKQCHYKSSDEKIALVNTTGLIYGISRGSAVITVSYTENAVTKSDTIDVVVTSLPTGGG